MSIDASKEFIPVRIAVLTVSDSRSMADDRSGDILVARLEQAGHTLAARDIVTDDRANIAEKLRSWCADPDIDAILSTGGTGLTAGMSRSKRTAMSMRKRSRPSGRCSPMFPWQKSGLPLFSPAQPAASPMALICLPCRGLLVRARTPGTRF